MKIINLSKASIAVASLLATTLVSAASLDWREEYRVGSEQRNSRVKISGGVDNHYFGIEAKQSGEFDERQAADNEIEYGYNWHLSKKVRLQTAMPITFTSNQRTTYKPQVRVRYRFDNGLSSQLRYRHEIRIDGREDQDNLNRSKITGNLDYNWNSFQLGFEVNYAEDFFNGDWAGSTEKGVSKDYEWDYNFKIGYKEKDWSWRPYIELGNIACNKKDDGTLCSSGRQLRSRVGITYSF